MIDITHTVNNRIQFFSKLQRALLLVLIFSFVLSLILYLAFYPGTRKLFLFESLDKKGTFAESRFIPRDHPYTQAHWFTEDLLLGPQTDRYRPLFPIGTKLVSFFKGNDGTVYVDLSEEAALQKRTSSQTAAACKLLEQNLRKNYNMHKISISIAGHKVYEYTD